MKLLCVSGIGVLFLLIVTVSEVYAQTIKVGDSSGGLMVGNISNYTSSKLRFSDLSGKVVLLDFWNIYCSACIQSFPKLDSLQQLFKGQLQIVLVNRESPLRTEAFFKKYRHISKPNVPMIMGDTLLHGLFPSDGLPYVVWIDKQGVIRNFSGGASVSKRNVQSLLDGKSLVFRDPTLERHGSLVDEDRLEYASVISRCQENLNVGNNELQPTKNGQSLSIRNNCSSIVNLFLKAYQAFGKNRFRTQYGLRLEVSNPLKFTFPSKSEDIDWWLGEHAYNYQLLLPANKEALAYEVMQADLSRFFDVDVKVEKTPVEGLVFFDGPCQTPGTAPWCEGQEKQEFKAMSYHADSVHSFKDVPITTLVNWLKMRLDYFVPVVDNVCGTGSISVTIRKSSLRPLRVAQLAEDLQRSGLACRSQQVLVDVLYIRDRCL